jgi:hypothetical protein
MKTLLVNQYGQCKTLYITDRPMPRVGEHIGVFYKPYPVVTSILHILDPADVDFPGADIKGIDAIITVE